MTAPVDIINASIAGGHLTWTTAHGSGQVKTEEILFVLDPADKHVEYFICSLVENSENQDARFRLGILRTGQVPQELQQYLIPGLPSYLRPEDGTEVDIIVSTHSGAHLALEFWQGALQPLLQLFSKTGGRSEAAVVPYKNGETRGPGYRLLITESADSVRNFARDLWAADANSPKASRISRTVVLLTGDGGVADLLNGSDEGPAADSLLPVMALLPLGTANALFHSIHKPSYSASGATELVLGLRTLFGGAAVDLPVFRASFSPGSHIVTFADKSKESGKADEALIEREEVSVSHLNGAIVASYGFHASIVYESDTPEYRIHGIKRFGMVAQELLKESHPYAATVEVRRPGSSSFESIPREKHAYVLTTLVSNLERGFTISPHSKPLEGRLRVVHFGPVGGERTMQVMMNAYADGKHVGMKWDDGEQVGYEEVEEIRVTILEDDERWRNVCIDGTIVEIPRGGHMSVKRLERGLCRVLEHSQVPLN